MCGIFLKALSQKKNEVDKKEYAACAGVAIVHQKYPFYRAYELAERLCNNAKKFGVSFDAKSGKMVSAIDWHIEWEAQGIASNVKAGYITLKSGSYYISEVKQKFDKGANYLMLSSRYILSHKEDFPFFMQKGKNYMMYTEDCVFERKEIIDGKYNGKPTVFIIKTENKKKVEEAAENGCFSFEESQNFFDKKGRRNIEIKEIGKPGKYEKEGKLIYKDHKIKRRISYEPKNKNMTNESYRPYYAVVFFQLDKKGKRVLSVYDRNTGESLPSNFQKGYVLSSGRVNHKKNLYIIPEEEFKADDAILIPSKDIRSFLADLKKRKTTLKRYFEQETEPDKCAEHFFGLPQKEGERKPVFYIKLGDRLYFGFTPRLRLFYDYEICQGINKSHEKGILDYSKAIFGYSNKKESFKSKVSFSDAVAEYAEEAPDFRNLMLCSPKPTSYLDYLVQNGNSDEVTYNDPEMELRGVKQYWLHRNLIGQRQQAEKEQEVDEFKPLLGKKTKFHGKIRFWNMTEDELGLLLWSIRLDPEKSRMNVGKAKPYGYGTISMKLTEVWKLNKQKAYTLEHFEFDPLTKMDDTGEELIEKYKENINQFLNKHRKEDISGVQDLPNERRIEDLPGIQDFFRMKDSTIMPNESRIRYMDIDKREYQSRKKPLPSVEETVRNIEERGE